MTKINDLKCEIIEYKHELIEAERRVAYIKLRIETLQEQVLDKLNKEMEQMGESMPEEQRKSCENCSLEECPGKFFFCIQDDPEKKCRHWRG